MRHKILKYIVMLTALLFLPAMAFAQEGAEPALSGGDTAWIIAATILVMMMTIPVWPCFMEDWYAERMC